MGVWGGRDSVTKMPYMVVASVSLDVTTCCFSTI